MRAKRNSTQEYRGCRQRNYTGSCSCDKEKDTYSKRHRCRVCTQDHPMLHCAKSRNPIYDDKIVVKFFNYGWPINYKSHQLQQSTQHNLPSALAFSDHVRAYIKAELSFTTIAGPFQKNPLHQHLICSPLQTVPKRGSTKRQVVMDLSYPPSFSVNSGISLSAYLDSPFKLRLPEIDRLREFILSKGRGCHVSKDISNALIANSQSIPKAITYWVLFFTINGIVTLDVPLG